MTTLTPAQRRALAWLPADGGWRHDSGRLSAALNSLSRALPGCVKFEWERDVTSWTRPAHWPGHWVWLELPEDNGDPRLMEAVQALMDVRAPTPSIQDGREFPVLSADPDFNELPTDHTEGIAEGPEADWLTQVGVVRLAKAVLAVADRYAAPAAPQTPCDGGHADGRGDAR